MTLDSSDEVRQWLESTGSTARGRALVGPQRERERGELTCPGLSRNWTMQVHRVLLCPADAGRQAHGFPWHCARFWSASCPLPSPQKNPPLRFVCNFLWGTDHALSKKQASMTGKERGRRQPTARWKYCERY